MPGDVRVNAARPFVADHLAACRNRFSADALREATLDSVQFGVGRDARHKVEGQEPLRAAAIASDRANCAYQTGNDGSIATGPQRPD